VDSANAGDRRRRIIMGAVLLVVIAAAVVGVLALIPGVLPSMGGADATRLTGRESESEMNRRGYELLRQGQTAAAIQVFQLNVERHPASANVYDSLGEAYVAAGERALAVANYEKALTIDPKKKSALSAIEELTGRERPPYRPLVLFHIVNGLLGILSGAAAMVLRKGSRRHSLAGRIFVVSMLSMSASAASIAFMDPNGDAINVFMGVLTFYLVATAWLTARRTRPRTGVVDWIGVAVVIAAAVGLVSYGVDAAASGDNRGGAPAAAFFVFAGIAALAAVLDIRMIRLGGVAGAQRLTRHLWRMCTALFIAATSFFLGQPQVFPVSVRNSGVLAVPSLLLIVALGYWLFRVNGLRRVTRATAA
jgi:uncharacterized membrane protein